jgi:hypothetical protein
VIAQLSVNMMTKDHRIVTVTRSAVGVMKAMESGYVVFDDFFYYFNVPFVVFILLGSQRCICEA